MDVVRNDYVEERRSREKMAQELNLFQQAKQRSDEEVACLKDQVTKQRSQIAVLRDLVDHVSIHRIVLEPPSLVRSWGGILMVCSLVGACD